MSTPTFLANPAFRGYVRLLGELHALVRQGADESAETEAGPERMDGPGGQRTAEEVAEATAISADFYQFSAPSSWIPLPRTPQADADLQAVTQAIAQGDHLRALRLLRACADYLPPAQLAQARGQVWQDLGETGIAAHFFSLSSPGTVCPA